MDESTELTLHAHCKFIFGIIFSLCILGKKNFKLWVPLDRRSSLSLTCMLEQNLLLAPTYVESCETHMMSVCKRSSRG
uniref:Uncharacterized protein n=1 Tax=Aegilops tauschii subsp. strangulata TaxID=200361 RepID=A0A453JGH0_AEGTS